MKLTPAAGARIRLARKALDLSQAELAAEVRSAQEHISRIETGEIANVSVHLALRLARALGTDVESLFGDLVPDAAA